MQLAGFDIAKPAVRLAAKALPAAKYAVASSFAQPVRTEWADLLLNCFSPFAQEEFRRVLRPGGRMIYVVPGAEHLYQMKAVLYDTPYKNPVQEVAYEGFRPIGEREVSGSITVPAGQLEALFAMTPYYWKTPRDGAARLAAEQLAAEGIHARVINIHTIKPLDEEIVLKAAKECGKVITAEEHSVIGGLGEAVCAVLSEKLPTPVRRVGVQDKFGCSGPAWDLLKLYGLDAATICKTAHEMLG